MTLPPHGFLHRSNGQQPPPTAAGVPLIFGIRVLSVNFYTEFRGDLVVFRSSAAAALRLLRTPSLITARAVVAAAVSSAVRC